jgi:hypothetical protein
VTPLLAWSPFGGVLESNFWTPASLVRLPFPAARVVMMAMSCVFFDFAQHEDIFGFLYMRIIGERPTVASVGGTAVSYGHGDERYA